MKSFVLNLLLAFAFTLPGSAESASSPSHRIVEIKEGLTLLVAPDQQWNVCSNYFFSVESPLGKKVYFHIIIRVEGKLLIKPIYAPIDQIKFEVNKKTRYPRFAIDANGLEARYILRMNSTDYIDGLPCLAQKGKEV